MENILDGSIPNYFTDDFEESVAGDFNSDNYDDDSNNSNSDDSNRGDDNDNDSDRDRSRSGHGKFNIREKIDWLLLSATDSTFTVTDNIDCIPLFDGSNRTVKEFSSTVISHCRKHTASSALITDIFKTFTDFFPSFNEASSTNHCGNRCLQILQEEKNVHHYPKTIHVISFDVCINGCMVYTDSTLRQCEYCQKHRFTPCTVCRQHNKTQYDPLSKDICQHENRIPFKQLKYRSITLLLVELLKFDSFRQLIKYKWGNSSLNETHDISDRNTYSNNLEEMHQTFEDYCQSNKSHKVVEVNILLSWFYDGIQLFNKKSSTFQPLLLTILNLPPSIRHEIGKGTFLLSYSLYKGNSDVEKVLLEDCMLEELQILNKGISFKIGGLEYFLQARMISHILDASALCPFLKFQPFFTSLAGCKLCNICRGTSIFLCRANNKAKHITKYIDSRNTLPAKHYLRSSGLSRNCCPKCDESLFNEFEKITIPDTANNQKDARAYYKQNEVNPDTLELCFGSENSYAYKKLMEYFSGTTGEDWVWFNHEVNLRNQFNEHLYFLSCDYRSKDYSFVSKENIIKIDNERRSNNEKELDGVKGLCCLYRLSYFKLSDICIEPYHALKGFLLEVVFKVMWQDGKNLRSPKIRRYYENICEKTGIKKMFPLILNDDNYPKCSFTMKERDLIQDTLKCILIPMGCSAKLKFAEFRIFDTTSFIGIADIITIMVVYMDLILLCSDHMHDVFKSYYRMLSLIIRKLIAPFQIIANIEPLYWRITEFRALTEGLFPVVCMTYMLHALQCVSKHIMLQGPLSSFSGLRGETNISKAKRVVKTDGGTKCEDLAYKKFFNKESEIISAFYGNFNAISISDLSLDIDENTSDITYMFDRCKVKNVLKQKVLFSDFEYDQILHLIIGLIEKKYISPEQCCINSSVYRIINIAKSMLKAYKTNYKTYQDCLFDLYDYLTGLENDVICSILNLENDKAKKFIVFVREQNLKGTESIHECLERLESEIDPENEYLGYIRILTNGERYKKGMESSDLKNRIYFGKYDMLQLIEINKKDILTSYDFLTLRGIVSLKKNVSISIRATIHGIKHYGRGFDYSEKEYYTNNNTNNIPTNELNNLSKHWLNPNQYSSWCKLGSEFYGQLNYFFMLSCIKTDKFVSELKVASITCRRTQIPKNMNNNYEFPAINGISLKRSKPNIFQTNWYKSDVSFIDIETIFPTRVATIGLHRELDKNGKFLRYKPIDCSKVIEIEKGIMQQKEEIIIDYLALIDVNPENFVEEETKIINTIHNMK